MSASLIEKKLVERKTKTISKEIEKHGCLLTNLWKVQHGLIIQLNIFMVQALVRSAASLGGELIMKMGCVVKGILLKCRLIDHLIFLWLKQSINMYISTNLGGRKAPPTIAPRLKRKHVLLNRGSYMSAHVLLNLLNELGKRDKMRGLPSIFSLFRNEFNKSNNTRARMLDSIYHMTLRLLWNLIFAVKTL